METDLKTLRPNLPDIPSIHVGLREKLSGEEIAQKIKQFYSVLLGQMRKVIVGQQEVIDLIMIGILCKGHVLLEGVPGLGKTLLFRTLDKLMNLNFQHVQFTPDLMPSDIVGTEIIQPDPATGERHM